MRQRKNRDFLVLIGLIALGFILARLQTSARNSGRTDLVSFAGREAVRPAATALEAVASGFADFSQSVVSGHSLRQENRSLRAIAASAATYQSDVDRLQGEIDELRRLGGWSSAPGREKVPADVIGYYPHESRITINVGAGRGVKRGMPVVTYEGLVGRVETADRDSAQVLLITAPAVESRISALVQRQPPNPPPAGLIRGESPNSLILELADPTATVESGDVVVTSGFSTEIPRGIVIGKIISVQDDPAFGKRSATVFPRVAIGQIHEVLVIK